MEAKKNTAILQRDKDWNIRKKNYKSYSIKIKIIRNVKKSKKKKKPYSIKRHR